MIAKRFTAALIGLASACVLTACHSGSTGSNTGTEAASKPSHTAVSPVVPTTSAAPDKASDAPGGIVLTFCPSPAKGVRNVEFIKPSTGDVVETRPFVIEPMKYTSAADCNSNLRGSEMRTAFNGDFTEVGAANNLWHTGVIQANHGFQNLKTKFVDLATGLNGKPPVSTIQQSAGAFGPDAQLYFVQKQNMGDDAKVIKVNPTGGTPKAANVSTDLSGFDPTEGANQLFFTDGNPAPQTDTSTYQVYSPDGKQFIRAGDGTITYGRTGTSGTTTEPNYGHTLWPFGFIDGKSFYGITDTGLVRATINGTTVHEQPLISATSDKLIDPTLSPDHQVIAYIKETDTTRELDVVRVSGGPVQKVMDLDRTVLGARILDWTVAK